VTNTIRTKEDVSFHYDRQRGVPALNIKVYGNVTDVKLPLALGQYKEAGDTEWRTATTEEGFTHEWIDTQDDDTVQAFWEAACETGFEQAKEDAEEIFGADVKVWQEGRSGGWLIVEGLPDFDSWDAIMLGRWRKFARYVDAYVDDVPHQFVTLLYMNVFEPEHEAKLAEEADDAAALLPIDAVSV
jgi:hypothetical protein